MPYRMRRRQPFPRPLPYRNLRTSKTFPRPLPYRNLRTSKSWLSENFFPPVSTVSHSQPLLASRRALLGFAAPPEGGRGGRKRKRSCASEKQAGFEESFFSRPWLLPVTGLLCSESLGESKRPAHSPESVLHNRFVHKARNEAPQEHVTVITPVTMKQVWKTLEFYKRIGDIRMAADAARSMGLPIEATLVILLGQNVRLREFNLY